jgi:glycosyltransferase involved in cell wall biosynthesis
LKEKKNIVYLYSEVMPYTIAVMRALVREHGAVIDCVYWDENKRTPFIPVNEEGITFHKRSAYNYTALKRFVEDRRPCIIYVAGRMDKLYLKVALQFRYYSGMRVVTGSDNQWTGSLKQKAAAFFSFFIYRRYFEFFWVPGRRQSLFAQKMGYAEKWGDADGMIINHLLTADTAIFGTVYERNIQAKKNKYPHNIVFAGRFAASKGIDLLVAAFREVKAEGDNDWQLTLIGSGDMKIESGGHISVKGFMSGEELAADSADWGVFCLPSRQEPWGVVVHEFTMAGLPMICSNAAGAADELVIEGHNGFICNSSDRETLKTALMKMMAKSDDELLLMSERSHELSKRQSPEIAADSLMSILKYPERSEI